MIIIFELTRHPAWDGITVLQDRTEALHVEALNTDLKMVMKRVPAVGGLVTEQLCCESYDAVGFIEDGCFVSCDDDDLLERLRAWRPGFGLCWDATS